MTNLNSNDFHIMNQKQLLETAENQGFETRTRIWAAGEIEDKSVFRGYVNDDDMFMRICAAQYIDDDELLLDLMLNDSEVSVRQAACRNFTLHCDSEKYGDILVEIALENPKYDVCIPSKASFVCHRIDDASKLLKIIEKSQNPRVYKLAMDKVDEKSLSQLLYAGILNGEKELEIALKLNDREKLYELLGSEKLNYENRIIAAMELGDDEKLSDLLEVLAGPRVSKEKVFADIFPADGLYKSIVFTYPSEKIAVKALNLIGYGKNLKEIIENHENPKIRSLAAERLKDLP